MVSRIQTDRVLHTRFRCLPDILTAGDTLVVNTSGTMPASVAATSDDAKRDRAEGLYHHRIAN